MRGMSGSLSCLLGHVAHRRADSDITSSGAVHAGGSPSSIVLRDDVERNLSLCGGLDGLVGEIVFENVDESSFLVLLQQSDDALRLIHPVRMNGLHVRLPVVIDLDSPKDIATHHFRSRDQTNDCLALAHDYLSILDFKSLV